MSLFSHIAVDNIDCIIYYDCFMLIVKHEEMLLRS
jgi:hypothetical protein